MSVPIPILLPAPGMPPQQRQQRQKQQKVNLADIVKLLKASGLSKTELDLSKLEMKPKQIHKRWSKLKAGFGGMSRRRTMDADEAELALHLPRASQVH